METKKDIYMISLDAVDLNSLPISQRHSDSRAVPLWSMSHLDKRRNDYYEFVIKADDTEEDLSEPVIKHVTCHICDINVPEVYFNEHKNGFRHKFNKKVTDTALKRLQMYVDKDDINKTNEKLSSKHFCVECSIVINSEDETSHKQTTAHRNSVFLERYLDDFLNFYANDDNEAVDNKSKDIKYGQVKESKNCEQEYIPDHKSKDIKSGQVKESKNCEQEYIPDHKSKDIKSGQVKESKNCEQEYIPDHKSKDIKTGQVKQSKNCEEKYIPDHKSKDIKTEQVKESKNCEEKYIPDHESKDIKTEQVKESKNCEEKYIPDHKSKDIKTEQVKESKNCEEKYIPDHESKDIKTEQVKESKNCEEKYISDEPNTEETLTINSSTNSDEQKSITENVTNVIKEKEESLKEDARETKEDERTDDDIARTNSMCDLSGLDIVFSGKGGCFQVPQVCFWALVQISASSEFCMLCNYMYNIENRSVHTESDLHAENSCAKPMDENCVRKINESHHHCALCNDYFTEYDLHVDSEDHVISFYQHRKFDDNNETDLDNDDCDEEDITHDSEDNASRTDDSESLADVNKNTDPLDTVNDLEPNTSVPVHPKVVCDTCNAWISKKQFRKHKKTPRHIFNAISDYHYLFKPFNDEYIYCLVCKGPIPNEMEIIKKHVNCRSHIRKYNELLNAHSIVRVYGNRFYCKECEDYILHKNEYMHMKMKTHSDKIGFCELDEIEVESDVSADADDTNADRNTSEANSGTAAGLTIKPANSTTLEANGLNNGNINYNPDMKKAFEDFIIGLSDWLVDVNKHWESSKRAPQTRGS